MRWYKRDPDAALAGMAELTLTERGAYNSLLDLLYSRDGDVPDNDALVARMIGCHWREWRAVKARLIDRGKVWVEGGRLDANRVQETLTEAAEFSQKQRKRAARRWQKTEKTSENNQPAMPPGNASTSTTTPTDSEAKASGAPAPIYTDANHELWGEGVPTLVSLGVKEAKARSMIGKWRKETKDDCQRVLGAIQRARDARPQDAIEWVTRALSQVNGNGQHWQNSGGRSGDGFATLAVQRAGLADR